MDRTALALLAAALLVPGSARSQGPGAAPSPAAPSDPRSDGAAPISTTPPPEKPAAPKDAAPKAGAPKPPLPRGAVLEDVSGTVHGVDRRAHRIEIDTASGRVELSLDRNTLVYGPHGLVTPLDVQPGALVRAGRNADFVAYWIAVRAPGAAEPASTPGQGTGPGDGAGVPPEPNSGPAGARAVPPSTVGPGSASPGGASPSSAGPGR